MNFPPLGKELFVTTTVTAATGLPSTPPFWFAAAVIDPRGLLPVEISLGHSQKVMAPNPHFNEKFEFCVPSAACSLVLHVRSSERWGP